MAHSFNELWNHYNIWYRDKSPTWIDTIGLITKHLDALIPNKIIILKYFNSNISRHYSEDIFSAILMDTIQTLYFNQFTTNHYSSNFEAVFIKERIRKNGDY